VSPTLIPVRRAQDLLVCEFELFGLEVDGQPPNRVLKRSVGSVSAQVVMHLPPQHIAEQAFLRLPREPTLVRTRAALPSRVAFDVADGVLPVPFQLEPLLGLLGQCRLSVVETADYEAPEPLTGWLALLISWLGLFMPAPLSEPSSDQTSIELPYRLIVSPPSKAGFVHATKPERPAGSQRVALWHTRLGLEPGVEGTEADAAARPLRAVWLRQGEGPEWSPTDPKLQVPELDEPFLSSMTQRDRADIVHLSGNPRLPWQTGRQVRPKPVATRRLALSALGAWLSSRGDWDPPAGLISLTQWTHRATQGRDHFVQIVRLGFIFPFGQRAALLKITERKFARGSGEPALLQQHEFVVISAPLQTYEPAEAPPGLEHTMPLTTVELKTLVTPDLEIPQAAADKLCFLIREPGSPVPFLFKLRGDDGQHEIDLQSPLVFLDSTVAWDATTIMKAKGLYDGPSGQRLRADGASIALAPSSSGDTTFPADELTFSARPAAPMPDPALDPTRPGFWPELVTARVRAPALQILTGQGDAATVEYDDAYKTHGLGGDNRGEVIAKLANALPLDFATKGDRAGALLQPSMAVGGLSRQLGPVGGAKVDEIAAGTFDPKNFFAAAQGRLFGVFTLDQVLARITGATGADMPRIVTDRSGGKLRATVIWQPVAQSYPPTNAKFVTKTTTKVNVSATIEPTGASPSSEIEAWLEQFELHLIPPARFIELDFERVKFRAEAGRKPDVDVVLRDIRFVGVLSFVERLRKLIPIDGFTDPPALDVTPSGITSSFSMAVPDLAVGVFSLQNLRLGAGFAVPFQAGALTVRFSFCERERPFSLTVSLFGGGGFFALAIDPDGVQMLEAALEFGASVSVDLGVASGGVHVMAGIYFKFESANGATLSGYFRMGGNVSVLGLISVCVELYLALTYEEASGKAAGRATLTVEVEVFLFSTSVQITCERKFAGSASDPTFAELMAPYEEPDLGVMVDPWQEYCSAYA
jgi:hypothetical protein